MSFGGLTGRGARIRVLKHQRQGVTFTAILTRMLRVNSSVATLESVLFAYASRLLSSVLASIAGVVSGPFEPIQVRDLIPTFQDP